MGYFKFHDAKHGASVTAIPLLEQKMFTGQHMILIDREKWISHTLWKTPTSRKPAQQIKTKQNSTETPDA